MRKHRHVLLDLRKRLLDAADALQVGELGLQQWRIGGFDRRAGDVFDDLIALVHCLLDQRIAAERADNVEAFDIRLVLRADRRHRGRVLVREDHAAGFYEAARSSGPKACDDAVEEDLRTSVCGIQDHSPGLASGAQCLDLFRCRVVVALDQAVIDGFEDRAFVAFLGAPEFVLAIDDDDVVLPCQSDCVLDRGIAGTDDDDGFTFVGIRIIELVLDEGQILAGNAELAQVALQADAEDHGFGLETVAILAADFEDAVIAPIDCGDFVAMAHVDLEAGAGLVPAIQDRLAQARLERNGRTQRQDAGFVHHVFALLVQVDRVRQMRFGLEQHVRYVALGRTRCRRQAARPGSDDGDFKPL